MDCNALQKNYVPLKNFRLEIISDLSKCCKESRKGRRSSDNNETRTIKHPVVERPDSVSRLDCYGHWPVHTSKGRYRHCAKGTSLRNVTADYALPTPKTTLRPFIKIINIRLLKIVKNICTVFLINRYL